MAEEVEGQVNLEEVVDGDVVFACPHCDKSLCIDPRAAGLSIVCPDCGNRIEVPIPEGAEAPAELPELAEGEEITDNDIVFDCPHCGKSLCIDQRGAGLMITCSDCEARIEVPSPHDDNLISDSVVNDAEDSPVVAELRTALAASQHKVREQIAEIKQLSGRRSYLEKNRVEMLERVDLFGRELNIIQSALDRLVSVLQDAEANAPKAG